MVGHCQDFPSKFFVSQYLRTLPGNLLCCVSEIFRQRKSLWIRRGYQDFPSKVFCLTVPKNFVGEPLCAVFHKISGSQKVYG